MITVPQIGWIENFTEKDFKPLWKPEMRPGSYRTTFATSIVSRKKSNRRVINVPKGTNVWIEFTKEVNPPGRKSLRSALNGCLTDFVYVTAKLDRKNVKGFVQVHNKRKLLFKYMNYAYTERAFQTVREKSNNFVAIGAEHHQKLNQIQPRNLFNVSAAPSVVSEATFTTEMSGVSSLSSVSVSGGLTYTGSKFGEAGIYKLKRSDAGFVYKDEKFSTKNVVQRKWFNKRTDKYENRDATIKRGQEVSVLKLNKTQNRAYIVAPFEGWIEFSTRVVALVERRASVGDLFKVHARKKTVVLDSNSFNGRVVGHVRRDDIVTIRKFSGASAQITSPIRGWIDIVGAALKPAKKADIKPQLLLSGIPTAVVQKTRTFTSRPKSNRPDLFVDGADKVLMKVMKVFTNNGALLKNLPQIRVIPAKVVQVKQKHYEYSDSTAAVLTFNSFAGAQLAMSKVQSFKVVFGHGVHQLNLKWSDKTPKSMFA